ncbi:methionine--tRNA ligase [Erythrobacter arachoides]|uniref:Methionine--tRNA ligase n=1 Tax=Aurantiacibacter arachoides TaxID=1850444 RepID=A0A845A0Y0_9SPHN|nr:methionine--tRNA ligase [Aurantiacibacter arachoides]MXO93210.1 methionine--tRNA ligase [Aurantiacibacter arachoides]GGD51145.1 methionine--tRNA ligase [Aurantiacibacter arachoides]
MADPFYITTAIHYPNGRPHIGHAYETIAADVLARFHRQAGREVRFQTGTDEHGLKMAQKARELGVTPRELADEMSGYFRDLFAKLNISHDRFFRTSEDEHHRASQALWRAMEENGDLYLDRYEGWYSIRDEAYYDESELTEGEGGEKVSPQGTPVEWTVEESWFFRLSKYQQPLLDFYRDNPDFIRPESRRNEVMRFVEGGLRDLSVSRTSFDWGVKVPGHDNHVMYVWVDALTNYLTGLGFPDDTEAMAKFWPADLHLIGKDIVRFHAVYWPAFLMSAGVSLPKHVFGHGFLLNRGQKESKSLGNTTDPGALADRYGVDVLRYFLLREFSFGQDGSYSQEAIVSRSNSELANSFGNLAQRTLSLIFKNCDGILPPVGIRTADDDALLAHVGRVIAKDMPAAYTDLAFAQALESWMGAVFACNAYIDAQAPWTLKKTDFARMETVLATLYVAIAQLALAVEPVMPTAMDKLLGAMGVGKDLRTPEAIRSDWYAPLETSDFRLAKPEGLFPRLELPEAELS